MSLKKRYLSLSVHQLVDFLLRKGDIDDRIYNQETMQMGSKLHSAFQAKQGKEYLSEYPLSGSVSVPEGEIALQGRADGIIVGGKEIIVDEIKSTVDDLDHFHEQQGEWHFGQALVYAFLYLKQNGGTGAIIHLTYLSQKDSSLKKIVQKRYSKKEIESIVEGYVSEYLRYFSPIFSHRDERDASAKEFPFPYGEFRPGQRELAKYCFGIARHGGILFAEAPTGIGKTMSTLFPFAKSFQQGRVERIFYLTAKNTGAIAAYQAIGEMQLKGLKAYDSTLYSRDKICLSPGHRCNPLDCPFAKDYYSKVKDVLSEILQNETRFDYLTAVTYARKHCICPFEMQLDLSLFSDIIVCDYNYFFDPIVHLERYFDDAVDQSKFLLLVDEAHNLVERGRSMYSSSLTTSSVRYAVKSLTGKKKAGLLKAVRKVESSLDDLLSKDGEKVLEESPIEVEKSLTALKNAEKKETKEHAERQAWGKALQDVSREGNRYLRLLSNFPSPSTRFLLKRKDGETELTYSTLDPSPFLASSLSKVKGAVLFSATLSPVSYFNQAILGKAEVPYLLLPSPFPKENFLVMVAPKVSVRYKDRENSYEQVAEYLRRFVEAKTGNYFLYFPSYEYLEAIRPILDLPSASVLTQSKKMTEEEKRSFLDEFSPNPQVSTVGLLTLGGAFSEGVDLVSDRLCGVAIVGVGLPQMNLESNLLRDYYEKKEKKGFSYAYMNPGMNKVMQALGRVIRSETDVGAALLIDDRYLRSEYRDLLERTHPNYEIVFSPQEEGETLHNFYSKKAK